VVLPPRWFFVIVTTIIADDQQHATHKHTEKINEFKTVYGLHCLVWRRLSFFTNFRPTTNFIEAIFICYLYSLTIRIGPAVYI
jgi:hypothetical protein